MHKRRILKLLRIGVWLLVPLLLWLAFRGIAISDIANILKNLHPTNIFILVVINFIILLMFSGRWWLLLNTQGYRIPYLTLVKYRIASFGLTYFTPGPQFGGEPLQVYLLHQHSKVPTSVSLASVMLDKILEIMVIILFLLVGLTMIIFSGFEFGISAWQLLIGMAGILAIPISCFLLLCTGRLPITWILSRISSNHFQKLRSSKVSQMVISTEMQSSEICQSHTSTVFVALLFSLIIWFVIIFEYWIAFQFLGLTLDLSNTIILLTAARLAYFTPMPAGLGSLEASQVIAISALGLPAAMGISISLLARTRDMLLASLGLWFVAQFTQKTFKEPLISHIGD
ncbi:MAG: flippase-like domain-containing protein [Anaerolineales bacterium]|nr:flippase-like domain-containing protein [Anaerolineales bacterium]